MLAILSAILGTLGLAAASTAIQDGMVKISNNKIFAGQWKEFIKDLQKIINSNSQKLADFKTKSESEKAYLINSILSGSGLGARAESLKQQFDKLVQQEKQITDEITNKNSKAQNDMYDAENKVSHAQTGVLGMLEAGLSTPKKTSEYQASIDQNIDAGVQGGPDNGQRL